MPQEKQIRGKCKEEDEKRTVPKKLVSKLRWDSVEDLF